MAIRTHAVLNPILATALPITISIPPRQNASVEALRLSLLGVAAVHQVGLLSISILSCDNNGIYRLIYILEGTPLVLSGSLVLWLEFLQLRPCHSVLRMRHKLRPKASV
jgi:hypothetical protein